MNKLVVHLILRMIIILSSIFMQGYIFILIFRYFNDYTEFLYLLFILLSVICTFYILLQDMKPDIKLSWIVSITVLPLLGGIIYLMFGRKKIDVDDQILYKEINYLKNYNIEEKQTKFIEKLGGGVQKQINYLNNIAKALPYENTETKYFEVGEKAFAVMIDELNKAEKFIFLEYFIIGEGYMWNTIEEILSKKVLEGVDVRVIYDDMGCIPYMPMGLNKRLREKNIACAVFNPVRHLLNSRFNNRDHRKICVIDGNVGFTGGINIADNYINMHSTEMHWKDTAVMLRGEGVFSLTMMFLSMWSAITKNLEVYENYRPTIDIKAKGIVQSFSDTPIDNESVAENLYKLLISDSYEELAIMTPYLAPSHDILNELLLAAKSGVKVKLILPRMTDNIYQHFLSRTYYEELIKSGVRVFEYLPGFTHAKMIVSDQNVAILGTINVNFRSFNLNYECGVWMYETDAVKEIYNDFNDILSMCEEITLSNLPKTKNKFIKSVGFAVMRIFSPLL